MTTPFALGTAAAGDVGADQVAFDEDGRAVVDLDPIAGVARDHVLILGVLGPPIWTSRSIGGRRCRRCRCRATSHPRQGDPADRVALDDNEAGLREIDATTVIARDEVAGSGAGRGGRPADRVVAVDRLAEVDPLNSVGPRCPSRRYRCSCLRRSRSPSRSPLPHPARSVVAGDDVSGAGGGAADGIVLAP